MMKEWSAKQRGLSKENSSAAPAPTAPVLATDAQTAEITSPSTSTSASPPPPPQPPSPIPSSLLNDDVFVQVLHSNVWRSTRLIQRAMRLTLSSARSHAYITNPYLIPPARLRRAMAAAAQRGVDVRVLMSGEISDVPVASMASQHLYHSLLRSGVKIYEMRDKVLHAKVVTIDGVYTTLGSFNFDHFSDLLNLEVNIVLLDPRIARQVEKQFFADLARSREFTLEMLEKRTWWQRALHWLLFHLMRFIVR
jgi:cardiolipin synthase A/B